MTLHIGPTFSALALRAFARYPQKTAFRSASGSVTYSGVADMMGRMQGVLSACGIGRGDIVALLSANRWETWCAGVAVQALGAGVTYLHPMASLDSHLYQLGDSGAALLIVDADVVLDRGAELAAMSDKLAVLTLGAAGYGKNLFDLANKIGSVSPVDLSIGHEIGTLNYTGGTTGRPKGVVRTNAAGAHTTFSILADFELPTQPRYLASAPISHVSGTNVLPTLLRGGSVHLLGKFDPEQLMHTIEKERINFSLLVPTMIYTLMDHPAFSRFDLSSIELLLYGASPMSPSRLAEGIERIGSVFSQLYGQSECYPIAVLPKADHDVKRPELLSACGYPTTTSNVVLLDQDGNEVAMGEPGEICVRAPHAMQQYWQQPEQTRDAFTGGWLHTGDVARSDEQGRLYIVDRKKDMIISGGFNVYPREVEDVLTSHPAVSSAAVIGVADPKWGEAVQAVVVLKSEAVATADELMQLVKQRKGPVLAPKSVRFVDTLPVTPLGKIDKKALRAQS